LFSKSADNDKLLQVYQDTAFHLRCRPFSTSINIVSIWRAAIYRSRGGYLISHQTITANYFVSKRLRSLEVKCNYVSRVSMDDLPELNEPTHQRMIVSFSQHGLDEASCRQLF